MHKEESNEKYLENILKILRYHTIYTHTTMKSLIRI